ncbi:basic amino acid/polyamine antiporter [Bifidobacterium cuniculi]|uniref:Amino acid permease n=1 Tax=Bifidobacterium cuniculi TaxID=1688 RepID=A0A087AT55_9BIFI|nr:basic amino acid/polyamine antiporter [Bifidobacterium cuniculi]KFI61955.1 amino acid permease [Bifidobacterium cuniculi]
MAGTRHAQRSDTAVPAQSPSAQSPHSVPVAQPAQVGFVALFALVISAMVGGGVFSLPQNMAQHASMGGQLIAWAITGVGMWFIVDTLRILTIVQPDLKDGLYSYARYGFGGFVGFLVAYGYWICNCFSLVAYGVLVMSTMDIFLPGTFINGNNLLSVLVSSAIMWLMVGISMLGVTTGALINVVGTVCKIVPVVVFIIAMLTLFRGGIALHDFWGMAADGAPLAFDLSRVGSQVSGSMLVTLWLFIGMEGAVVVSGSARSSKDVSRATVAGYLTVLVLYVLVSILPLGVYDMDALGAMPNPSMSIIMGERFGTWGGAMVNVGVIVSVLFAWLVWTIMISQMPLFAARDGLFPRSFCRQNRHGAPAVGLLWTGVVCQVLFLVCHFVQGDAWNVMISITSVMAMPCYLLCCLYLWRLVRRRPTLFAAGGVTRRRALAVGILGSLFSLFLVYSAGLHYLMVACALFAIGLPIYAVARRQRAPGERFLSRRELILFAAIVVVGVIGVVGTWRSGMFG